MIERILAVIVVGGVFYAIIPFIASVARGKASGRVARSIKDIPAVRMRCVSATANLLTVQGTDARWRPDPESPHAGLVPRKTRFLALTSDGRVEFLRWSSIDLVRKGAPLLVFRPERGKPVCAFLDEERAPTASEIETAFARAPSGPEPLKPWSVAVGVFLEFLLFLESSGATELRAVNLLAIVGIFGKTLPYCPPGLFCTLGAHAIRAQKKPRRYGAAGVLLVCAGIAVNVGVIFALIWFLA